MTALGWIFFALTGVFGALTVYALYQWHECIGLLHEAGRLNQAYANLLRDHKAGER